VNFALGLLMSNGPRVSSNDPRFSRFTSQKAATTSAEISAISTDVPPSPNRGKPGDIRSATSYAGIGLILAANFAAIMTARRNYRPKRRIVFATQVRETIITWSGASGLFAVAAFTMKISNEFSCGAVIFFIVGGLGALVAWRPPIADLISKSLANGSFARLKIIVIAEPGQNAASLPPEIGVTGQDGALLAKASEFHSCAFS
jgi:hypothetical protein